MTFRRMGWLLLPALAACGGVGTTDESVALKGAGIDITVDLPKGGKVTSDAKKMEVEWVGLSWAGTFELDKDGVLEKKEALARDPSGAYGAAQPVSINGQRFTCRARAKAKADAERLNAVCEKLAAASLKASPSAGPKPAPSSGTTSPAIELETKSVPGMSCSVKIPKGAKTLAESKYSATYSLPLPGGLLEYNVSVSPTGAKSIAEAKKQATMLNDAVEDAKELGKGRFEVVHPPQGVLQTVHSFTAKCHAKCIGPTKERARVLEMCESLADEGKK